MKKNILGLSVGIVCLGVVLVGLRLQSCSNIINGGGNVAEGNLTISLPPLQASGRAIDPDLVADLKYMTTKYRVSVTTANGEKREQSGSGTTYAFEVPTGAEIQVAVECLNDEGDVIVRATKKHTMTGGVNNISVNLSKDGDAIVFEEPEPFNPRGEGSLPETTGGEGDDWLAEEERLRQEFAAKWTEAQTVSINCSVRDIYADRENKRLNFSIETSTIVPNNFSGDGDIAINIMGNEENVADFDGIWSQLENVTKITLVGSVESISSYIRIWLGDGGVYFDDRQIFYDSSNIFGDAISDFNGFVNINYTQDNMVYVMADINLYIE